MPHDPARAKLAYLTAWADQCEASARDALARSPARKDRVAHARCWAAATRVRSRVSRVRSERTRAETRALIAARRRRESGPAG